MADRVLANDKVEVHWHTEVVDVLGDKEVEGIRVQNNQSGEESDWDSIKGLFLAIGHKPNSDPFVDQLDHDETGYLLTQPGSTRTNIPGVFACGDIQDSTRQAAAAGSGCMAAIDAERWLDEQGTRGRRVDGAQVRRRGGPPHPADAEDPVVPPWRKASR